MFVVKFLIESARHPGPFSIKADAEWDSSKSKATEKRITMTRDVIT
jgi:hypothetical protein